MLSLSIKICSLLFVVLLGVRVVQFSPNPHLHPSHQDVDRGSGDPAPEDPDHVEACLKSASNPPPAPLPPAEISSDSATLTNNQQ